MLYYKNDLKGAGTDMDTGAARRKADMRFCKKDGIRIAQVWRGWEPGIVKFFAEELFLREMKNYRTWTSPRTSPAP